VSVFADTSALYAVIDRSDASHSRAAAAWTRLLSEDGPLVTHNYVLAETQALLQRRIGVGAALTFETAIRPVLNVHWVDAELHASAVAAVLGARSRKVSLVDHVSFELMRREGVSAAFTFDDGYRRMGFRLYR